MPSPPFILISTTILWPGTNKIYDFWDARSEQRLKKEKKKKENNKGKRSMSGNSWFNVNAMLFVPSDEDTIDK